MARVISRAVQWMFLSLFAASALTAAPSATLASPTAPPTTAVPDTEQLKASSAAAATQWLALVDQGKYDASWNNISLRLQLIFPKDSWVAYLSSVRNSLGKVQSRVIALQSPVENPKGLAPGLYMVILYNTTFSRQETKQELLTLVLEDNNWRVLSYNIGKIQ